jgi:hypothetical protein
MMDIDAIMESLFGVPRERNQGYGNMLCLAMEVERQARREFAKEVRDALKKKQYAGAISDYNPEARKIWVMMFESALELFKEGGEFEVKDE